MKTYDVAVVGGGPIGGFVARNIAKKGYVVALFEEHKKIGTPLKCAGLITPRVFDFLDFSKTKVVENEIYGAHIHSPSGNILTIGGDKRHALVIDRPKFDQEIMNDAEDAGVEIHLGAKASSAKRSNNHIGLDIVQNEQTTKTKSSILIGADGPYSKIRSIFDFPKPTEFLKGIGAKAENTDLDPKYVEIFLGRNIAPGFFAWAIPTNKEGTEARIGLCIDNTSNNTLKQCFNNLLKHKRLQNITTTKYIAGTIPLGALKKTTISNVMLVGDAAAQVKPTSGGGVYPGILCAKHCSSVALDALENRDFNSRVLRKYHKLWTNEIGRELSLGMKVRKIIKSLDDKKMDKYLEKINNEKNIDIICKYGDIDYPSKLAFPLLKKNPSLVKLLPSAFRTIKKQ